MTKIHDGDTITVRHAGSGTQVKVRLWGVDSPEYSQAYGKDAAEFLRSLLPLGMRIFVDDKDRDQYKRRVSVVRLLDGRVIQEELLKAGYVWVYRRHCRACKIWYSLEEGARREMRGLWKDDNPVAPWDWRKIKKGRK